MTREQVQHEVEVTFDDLAVLDEGDSSVFLLNWTLAETPPPYYVVVEGRRFSFTGATLLVKGHGAAIARTLQEHEAEGRLVLLVERDGRFLVYAHDPNATEEDDEE
jgi:hypothetical protein